MLLGNWFVSGARARLPVGRNERAIELDFVCPSFLTRADSLHLSIASFNEVFQFLSRLIEIHKLFLGCFELPSMDASAGTSVLGGIAEMQHLVEHHKSD